jgi:hypothetical protein
MITSFVLLHEFWAWRRGVSMAKKMPTHNVIETHGGDTCSKCHIHLAVVYITENMAPLCKQCWEEVARSDLEW